MFISGIGVNLFDMSHSKRVYISIICSGHDVYFCSDLYRRASEIQFSLALLQISLAREKLHIIIL